MKDKLDIKHPMWTDRQDVWGDVFFYENPHLANKSPEKWLKRRLDEDWQLYQDRLSKFTFTPLVNDSILDFLKKMSTGTLNVTPDLEGGYNLFLSTARYAMLYGCIWYQLKEDGLSMVNPQSVINWSYDDNGLTYVVLKSEYQRTELFEKPKTITQWTVVKRDSIETWECDGSSTQQIDSQPGLGYVPFHLVTVPGHLWVASLCYLKQRQYLTIENALIDTVGSTYIQRTFKPVLTPDDDLTQSYLNAEPDRVVSSNRHIIEGDFSFNEPTGSSVSSALGVLSKLEQQIDELVSRGNLKTATNANQSGLSKMYDYTDYDNHVTYYASHVKSWLDSAFEWVAPYLGVRYTMSGMDDFSVNRLSTMVTITNEMLGIIQYVPPDSLTIWFNKLGEAIERSTSI